MPHSLERRKNGTDLYRDIADHGDQRLLDLGLSGLGVPDGLLSKLLSILEDSAGTRRKTGEVSPRRVSRFRALEFRDAERDSRNKLSERLDRRLRPLVLGVSSLAFSLALLEDGSARVVLGKGDHALEEDDLGTTMKS